MYLKMTDGVKKLQLISLQVHLSQQQRKLESGAITVCHSYISHILTYVAGHHHIVCIDIQWGKKVFSQPPIVQVLPLKKMREACNFHHRYTSTMRDKIRKKKIQKITL